jgi:hypothetical protein
MFLFALLSEGLLVTLAVIGVVAGLAAIFGPSLFAARWILAPIDRAAKSRQAPARFSLGDFLCLFVIIQIPLAAVFRIGDGNDENRSLWMPMVIVWILGTVIWYMGSRTLSKAGVRRTWVRSVYLGLILPLVYYGLLPFTILSVAGCGIFFEEGPIDWITPRGVAIWLLFVLLFGASAWFTRWMLLAVDQDSIDSTTPDAGSIEANGHDSQFGAARLQ